jgi:hypothetical protein
VKLFEFKGLGSSPNKQKKHEVDTHALLATTKTERLQMKKIRRANDEFA